MKGYLSLEDHALVAEIKGCFNPFWSRFQHPITKAFIKVPLPCGHCLHCRRRRLREWFFRLYNESLDYARVSFLTLTYNEESKPNNGSLRPSDLQSFWKRLRYYLKKYNIKIRYFACGEYGDRTQRPHYHAIIFGIAEEAEILIKRAWQLGFIMLKPAYIGSLRYVAGYVLKKLGTRQYQEQWLQGREPPFQRTSQGLGIGFLRRIKSFTPFAYIDDRIYYIGRYLINKALDRFSQDAEVFKLNAFVNFLDQFSGITQLQYFSRVEQYKRDLKAKNLIFNNRGKI